MKKTIDRTLIVRVPLVVLATLVTVACASTQSSRSDAASAIDSDFRDLGSRNGNYSVMYMAAPYADVGDLSAVLLRGFGVAYQLSSVDDTLIVILLDGGFSNLVLHQVPSSVYGSYLLGSLSDADLIASVIQARASQ